MSNAEPGNEGGTEEGIIKMKTKPTCTHYRGNEECLESPTERRRATGLSLKVDRVAKRTRITRHQCGNQTEHHSSGKDHEIPL